MEEKKSNSGLIVLIVVLVILILGLGGFIGYSLLNGNLTFDNSNNNSNKDNNNENNQHEEIEISNEEINTYLSYVPFSYTNMYDDDDMSNGLDAYSGKTTNLDNINKEILWENAYNKISVNTNEDINIKVKNEICGKNEYDEYNSCTPNELVSKEDMDNELKTMYNIENKSINSFNVAGGGATFYDYFYAIFFGAGSLGREKVSVLDKYEIENDNLIIYEKAGFILEDFGNYIVYKFREDYNKNIIKKFEGTIDESDTREKEAKDYIKDNINDFATFKHTFKLNKETNKYYWYQTEVV